MGQGKMSRVELNMDEDKLRQIVQESVRQAFKEVGLHDDDARDDIKSLRGLLKTYRQTQSAIIKTVVTFITVGILSLISLGFYNRMNGGGE
jgi:ABC-type transporter Mla subunit MlaD